MAIRLLLTAALVSLALPVSAGTITFTDLDLGADGQFCGAESSPLCAAVVDGVATVSMSDVFPGDIRDGALRLDGRYAGAETWFLEGSHTAFSFDVVTGASTAFALFGLSAQGGQDLLLAALGPVGRYAVSSPTAYAGLLWSVEGAGELEDWIALDNIEFGPTAASAQASARPTSVPEPPTWLLVAVALVAAKLVLTTIPA